MENIEIVEQEVVNRPNGRRNTVIITITVAVALALIIFAVYKVFSNYPFTLPSYVAFYIIILALFIFFFPLTRTYLGILDAQIFSRQTRTSSICERFPQGQQ